MAAFGVIYKGLSWLVWSQPVGLKILWFLAGGDGWGPVPQEPPE